MSAIFDTRIEFLKGIGPQKASVINKELEIFTYGDLIQHYPFRYEDRTTFQTIAEVNESFQAVQIKGKINYYEIIGEGPKKRFTAYFSDQTGEIELIWFRSIPWISKSIKKNAEYIIYGKPSWYLGSFNIIHPEIEPIEPDYQPLLFLQPVYHTSEKLKSMGFDSKGIGKLIKNLLVICQNQFRESLTLQIIAQYQLTSKREAMNQIHFPESNLKLEAARFRLKFEELFYNQLKLLQLKGERKQSSQGFIFRHIPLLNTFYKSHLPFDLTNAQKKVIKEIYADMVKGKQMNRLLQGDVGSGKTIVAFITILMAIDGNTQACLMAPTEILAAQHYQSLQPYAEVMNLSIAKLTGSSKKSERDKIHQQLLSGHLNILIGTHALLEEKVQFNKLGVCVIDEQHRFGVAQRAKLWNKNKDIPPHILVMTATPIPRTLAMTLYGDLDISVLDELPAGRKPIKTVHRFHKQRLGVNGFLKQEIKLGRQVYIVYPLIEESEKSDLADLYTGYEVFCKEFPKPEYQIGILHGRMSAKEKNIEMERFLKNETNIMVATTVIEVGVNVPNATVMLVENAERFGLAQLHQLRGRVGRGAEQSYCILMTDVKLSHDTREKLSTLVRTTDGFEIAEADLRLRGPGDMMGTRQSGILDFLIADLSKDQEILKTAREAATLIIEKDKLLTLPESIILKSHIDSLNKNETNWSKIS